MPREEDVNSGALTATPRPIGSMAAFRALSPGYGEELLLGERMAQGHRVAARLIPPPQSSQASWWIQQA